MSVCDPDFHAPSSGWRLASLIAPRPGCRYSWRRRLARSDTLFWLQSRTRTVRPHPPVMKLAAAPAEICLLRMISASVVRGCVFVARGRLTPELSPARPGCCEEGIDPDGHRLVGWAHGRVGGLCRS